MFNLPQYKMKLKPLAGVGVGEVISTSLYVQRKEDW